MWADKRYHTLNYHLRQKFKLKIFKLPLDAGFSCPNRDGTIAEQGCIYCSARGSGDFAGDTNLSIIEQAEQSKRMMHKKWPEAKYIAYFQAYTNTWSNTETLAKLYEEALAIENVVGLAISTRPDCISPQTLNLLSELNNKTYLWVELGVQTIHDRSLELIGRGHDYNCFLETLSKLQARNISTTAHVIYGLPGEDIADMQATARAIAELPLQGIKLHALHILKGTALAKMYEKNPFPLLTREQYIELIAYSLALLDPRIIVHRLTGDGPRDLLVAPAWTIKKWETLNAIDAYLKSNNISQGIKKFTNP